MGVYYEKRHRILQHDQVRYSTTASNNKLLGLSSHQGDMCLCATQKRASLELASYFGS
jgi:hypothetical protein